MKKLLSAEFFQTYSLKTSKLQLNCYKSDLYTLYELFDWMTNWNVSAVIKVENSLYFTIFPVYICENLFFCCKNLKYMWVTFQVTLTVNLKVTTVNFILSRFENCHILFLLYIKFFTTQKRLKGCWKKTDPRNTHNLLVYSFAHHSVHLQNLLKSFRTLKIVQK